jgi:hypothetical protein
MFMRVVYGCADKQILFQKNSVICEDPGRFTQSQAEVFTITDMTSSI